MAIIAPIQTSYSETNAVTITVTAGSVLHVWGLGAAAASMTASDNKSQSYSAALDTVTDSPDDDRIAQFYAFNAAAGSTTITVANANGVCVMEIGGVGSADPLLAHKGQLQATPGLGTDALTTGAMTPASQPNLAVGLSICTGLFSSGLTPTAGTGFTAAVAGWNFGAGGNLANTESKRTTSTASDPATFSAAQNTSHLTIGAIYLEGGASAANTFFRASL